MHIAGSWACSRKEHSRTPSAPIRSTPISAVIAPRGKARQVEDGYALNGFLALRSGCEHADWLFLGAAVVGAAGETIDEGDLLVPVGDITIKDDWHVSGLRGTGSCSIVAKDVFVPKHRYLSLPTAIQGRSPGVENPHDGWLYKSAAVPVLALAITPAALGAAQAALEGFVDRLPGREVAYTQHEVQIDMPVTHLQIADAATKIDVARLLSALPTTYRRPPSVARRWTSPSARASAWIAPMPCDSAWKQSSSSISPRAARASPTLVRHSAPRDVHAINMHGLLNLHERGDVRGVLLGRTPNTPLI